MIADTPQNSHEIMPPTQSRCLITGKKWKKKESVTSTKVFYPSSTNTATLADQRKRQARCSAASHYGETQKERTRRRELASDCETAEQADCATATLEQIKENLKNILR